MAKDEDALRQVPSEEGKVVEIEDSDLDEDIEEAEIDDEAGIFDEDLISEGNGLGDDLVLGEEDVEGVGEFFIGDTILSSGDAEVSWSKEDLEEVVRNERIEKDWGDSEEFVGSDFYNAANGDFYGSENRDRNGFYETERGGDLYKDNQGGDLYNTGGEGVYAAGKTDAEGVYDVSKRGGMRGYDEVVDNRRKGRSVLEMAGFEDKEKQKDRDTHSLMKYDAKKAA